MARVDTKNVDLKIPQVKVAGVVLKGKCGFVSIMVRLEQLLAIDN